MNEEPEDIMKCVVCKVFCKFDSFLALRASQNFMDFVGNGQQAYKNQYTLFPLASESIKPYFRPYNRHVPCSFQAG